MNIKEREYEDLEWIYLAQVGSCEHGNEPSVFIKVAEFLD
jgi:hypothetical protein